MTFGAKLSLQGRFCARTQTEFCPTSSSPLPSHLPPSTYHLLPSTIHHPPSTFHHPPSTFHLPAFTFHFHLSLPVSFPFSCFPSQLSSHISCLCLISPSPVTNLSPFIFYLSSPFSPLFPFSLLLSPVPSFFSFFSSFPCFTAQQDRSPISSLSFPTLDTPVHSLVRKACQKHADLPHQESNRTD